MALVDLVGDVALVVIPMLVVTALTLIGPRRLSAAVRTYRWRLAAITTPLLLLVAVLVARVMTRDLLGELSRRVVGTYFTGSIFSFEYVIFETNPVVFLQSFQTEPLTAYFAFIYVYGYVFLLVFPFIAYFALSEMDDLNTLVVAYTANYAIGLVLYTLFIAYGPRNYNPLIFESLLYDAFPDFGYLTHEVNEPTNVFPSLHTSLSMTVLFMAWQTRDKYPLWVPISAVFAISVVVSTMYLGIHWFSDVVVGTLLALCSVYLGRRYTERDLDESLREFLRRNLEQVRTSVGW
ncbi:phosphatase PAP2 family protein [Halobacteria archaeon AArc-m2/3/4]|uniref:Phosphatase PAP2 family protein n=1 Tax=Natronoglomus mannanivorans TaxID=2979990 RepID=A0AAP2YWY0_9EURY|nr:phosphatase PAP2 family protein [Halobacteria archaeon AArc-xg1-1]MCU4971357.1 phosphatase PAP2 family protein [Halobacteria archaeon AArc-m2/3/4]